MLIHLAQVENKKQLPFTNSALADKLVDYYKDKQGYFENDPHTNGYNFFQIVSRPPVNP
jgi:hypothetical protein